MRSGLIVAVTLLFGGLLSAQPKNVDVFAKIGFMKMGADEGPLGTGAAYGGGLLVPFTRKLAVDLDVLTARAGRDFASDSSRYRRTIINPALVYRWGNERVYAFAGGGVGAEFTRYWHEGRNFLPDYTPPGWTHVAPGVWQFEGSDSAWLLVGKAGVVANPHSRLLIRFDFYWAARYALPNIGLTAGVGWRF